MPKEEELKQEAGMAVANRAWVANDYKPPAKKAQIHEAMKIFLWKLSMATDQEDAAVRYTGNDKEWNDCSKFLEIINN